MELSLLIGNQELLVERGVPLVDYRFDPIIFRAIRPYIARDVIKRTLLLSLILKIDGRWLQRYILIRWCMLMVCTVHRVSSILGGSFGHYRELTLIKVVARHFQIHEGRLLEML